MGNMSYCRFENTLKDLRDCQENWDELDRDENPSQSELKARERLLKLCKEIVGDYIW